MFVFRHDKLFTHCMAFFQQGPFIQRIEPLRNKCELSIEFWTDPPLEPIPAELYAEVWAQKGAIVVRHDFERNFWNISNLLPSCVSLVKILTGYNSYTFTPYGLYKDLLRNGGVQIFGDKNGIYET